ncbi:hypothetical protein BFAG_00250 [Bacteroides fragilis 3_1_12]|uniref:Transmembrane protein n=1 Tax=Bacteroides fragilis 3_1_12 TaxID=457424 RepID=A0ABN0BF72_BACFG|nr:hypothetical protein BFAG_00250 [Bacteroides fragilis 3_1_12]
MIQLVVCRGNVVEHLFYLFALFPVIAIRFDLFLWVVHFSFRVLFTTGFTKVDGFGFQNHVCVLCIPCGESYSFLIRASYFRNAITFFSIRSAMLLVSSLTNFSPVMFSNNSI